jgi:UDP-N-acetylglucosamine--N-acetylmuramyl-(pentapeptide) pyrophosphoryl-undecaprenol N-acetylglucosamine transferase
VKIVLTGGGTGGHIYPALAIGRYCQQQEPNTELLYIGSDTGLERDIVPKAGVAFEAIRVSGFRRKVSLSNLQTVWHFVRAVSRSKKLLRRFKPDVVIGTGGYVCGPVMYAAAQLNIPTMIHEQNVLPGLTNRFLSRYADVAAVSFPGGEKYFTKSPKVVYTGNPRASEVIHANPVAARERLGIKNDVPIVVFVGGSRGARALTELMIAMAPLWQVEETFQVVYVTGAPYYETTVTKIQKHMDKLKGKLIVVPYVDQFPDLLAASSLVVCRSGASSIAELTAFGIPSIQVPSPNVTNNHQEANARRLVEAGAAEMVLERDLHAINLSMRIRKLMGVSPELLKMRESAKAIGKPDSAQVIYELIREMKK